MHRNIIVDMNVVSMKLETNVFAYINVQNKNHILYFLNNLVIMLSQKMLRQKYYNVYDLKDVKLVNFVPENSSAVFS